MEDHVEKDRRDSTSLEDSNFKWKVSSGPVGSYHTSEKRIIVGVYQVSTPGRNMKILRPLPQAPRRKIETVTKCVETERIEV